MARRALLLEQANAHFDAQEWEPGAERFRDYLEREPDDGSAHFRLGYCVLKSGRPLDAVAPFERAIELDVQTAASTYNVACCMALAGERDAALEWLRRSIDAGISDLNAARNDADFASLREDPEFLELTTPVLAWKHVLAWLEDERDRMAENLEAAHELLYARADPEHPALAKRLSPEPPRPLESGYGILPKLTGNLRLGPIEPRESFYSLERVSRDSGALFRDAAVLASRARAGDSLPLARGVEEFERLKGRLDSLEKSIAYHRFWQADIGAKTAWYDGRNEVIRTAREMKRLRADDATAARATELQRGITDEIAPFRPTPGLRITTGEDGVRVLAATIATDVEDDAFLEAFEAAIDEAWSSCEAATELRFRVSLEIRRIAPGELYPEGVPERGADIVMDDHLARFPEGLLVLTTGAANLHARLGRCILLGPASIQPRVLAHEFGHLLGFQDAYLRGYDGDPGGPFGVRVIEWVGLMDDLMGGPGIGRVTEAMIEQLLAAYGPEAGANEAEE